MRCMFYFCHAYLITQVDAHLLLHEQIQSTDLLYLSDLVSEFNVLPEYQVWSMIFILNQST